MTIKKIAIALTAVLAFGGLSACGSSTDAYCDALQDTSKSIDADMSDPKAMLKQFEKIAAKAPSEIKGDWKTVTEGMKLFTEDPAKAAELDQDKYLKALENISKNTESSCDVKLPTP